MKKPFISFLWVMLLFFVVTAYGQQVQIPASELVRPTDLPIQVRLFNLSKAATSNAADMQQIIDRYDIIQRSDGKVSIKIIHPRNGETVPPEILQRHQIEVYLVNAENTSIYIEAEKMIALAEDLPEGYVLYQEVSADPMNEGPTPELHNSWS